MIILLAASAPEEALPILSGIVLPLLDGGRGGVDDTARLDCDFSPKTRKQTKNLYSQHTNEVKVYFFNILLKHQEHKKTENISFHVVSNLLILFDSICHLILFVFDSIFHLLYFMNNWT